MLWKWTLPVFVLMFAASVMIGCAGQRDTANTANVNTAEQANANRAVEPNMEGARDNAEELASLVKMPYEPEDLAWKELPGPQGRRLVAVFQLTGADAQRLVDNASKVRPGTPVSINPEKWFPKELTTQNEMSGESGVPATGYAAEEFFQEPFTKGTVSRVIDTDFFVLEVFAR